MSSVYDILSDTLDDSKVRQIGNLIGADQNTAEQAISGAVPLLLAAMGRNASSASGLEALNGALSRDHDGSLLDGLGGFLKGGGDQDMGSAILGHILGGRQGRATEGLSRTTGLDSGAILKLLAVLAPIVMAALSRAKQTQARRGGPASSDGGVLGDILRRDNQKVETHAPDLGGLLGSLLDKDGDGPMDDIARLGSDFLGSIIRGGGR